MDNASPKKPAQLLNDLELIRSLLNSEREPKPRRDDGIPLLSDIIDSASSPRQKTEAPARLQPSLVNTPEPKSEPARPAVTKPPIAEKPRLDPQKLDAELRASAQLILQEVIADFTPQIEAELRLRMAARLEQLLQ